MTRACLAALLSHWQRSPLQLFTFLAGLALATALWSGVQAINAEARASYDAAAATLGEGRFDQLYPRASETIPQETYINLRRAGWQVSPVLEGTLRAGEARVRIVGLDPLTTPGNLSPVDAGSEIDLSDFIVTGVLFANAETAATLTQVTELPVMTDPNIAPDTAITDIGIAQELLDQPGSLSRLIVAEDQPRALPLLAQVAPDLIRSPAQAASEVGQLTGSFHLNLTAFGLLSFAVGIFIVHGAIGLAFEQRRPMVRTLRALGVPLRRLITLMVAELLLLALVAGAIGVILGYLIAALLLPDVAATLEGLYGAQIAGTLQLRPIWWISGLAIAFLGTAIAAAGALWQIARMPILASARPRAWAMASDQKGPLQALVAIVFLMISAGLAMAGGGLIAGFVMLGCLLIGTSLLLPLFIGCVLTFGQSRASGIIGEWFWADTRQQLPGLSLALMALLLAIAANIGVSTMVSSFRLTFIDFLDQRLASELYVTAENPEQSAELERFLQQRAREILPLMSVDTRLADLPSELLGARIGQTYADNWLFLASDNAAWDRVAAGDAVIVNEQLARRADLWVGDTLAVGPNRVLPIAGIFGDYGNPIGQAIVSEPLFKQLFPDEVPRQFGVRTETPEALRTALVQDFGLPEGRIIDQAQIKAFSLNVFERTFTVTGALNVLTLAVAAFAILMSLLTLAALRLPQLAPVWALGLTQRTLGAVELIRAMVLALLTTALAVPLGLALAWILLAVVNVEAFGWRLPMYLFPGDYVRLGFFALIAAALAALWPAWRLAQTPPSALLKVFANER